MTPRKPRVPRPSPEAAGPTTVPTTVSVLPNPASTPLGGASEAAQVPQPHDGRGEGDLSLAMIEEMATRHRGRASIAAALGLSRRAFGELLAKDDDALMAFERGQAKGEEELVDLLLGKARDGNIVAILYATKTIYGWIEGQPRDPARPHVTIALPDAMSPGQYRVAIGIDS